ncbi:MAG: ATP-binding protein [Armatimonadota bacterium]|nr:ATP-binding protein [Armatimonadota bacterium]
MKLKDAQSAWSLKSNMVRVRLTLWNMGVLALALAGFALTVRYTVQATLAASVDRDLGYAAQHRSERISHLSDHEFLSFGLSGRESDHRDEDHPPDAGSVSQQDSHTEAALPAFSPVGRTDGRDDYRRPSVFDITGKALGPFSRAHPWDKKGFELAAAGGAPFRTILIDGTPVRVYSYPIVRNDHVIAVMQQGRPLSELYSLLDEMTRVLLFLIPVVLIFAGAGGAFLTNRAIRPLRQVIQAARQIGAEDLSLRLPVVGNDEFSELAATFNGMVSRLEGAFQRLEEAFEQQHRFTGDASHELRTPLTTIKAETSLALMGERTPEQYRQALRTADHAVDIMSRIVQDMLLVARSDAGQLNMEGQRISIGPVVQRAAVAVQKGHQESRIEVAEIDPSLQVLGDAHHLQRLFVNLLDNAARHTPPKGRVTASARAEGSNVVMTVQDTGEGIPPEHLPHVCERFYRVDAARTRSDGGTGLGLAICESIVQAHHGTMKIESTVGVGTTVTVTLPRCDGAGDSVTRS